MRTSYAGFIYEKIAEGVWRLTLPSRIKGIIQAETEDEVKAKIDQLIAEASGD